MATYIQVVTTVDKKETAERIAEHVVEQRLAACVQISPCESLYRWQGKIEKSEEYLCIMKSRQDLYREIEKAVTRIHPYDVPEILATRVLDGSGPYLEWIDEELQNINPV